MRRIRIRNGLDLPIPGSPVQMVESTPAPGSVALLAADFPGVRFVVDVGPGDRVKIGQALCTDRRDPRIRFPAYASGIVSAVHRDDRRRLVGIEIEIEGTESIQFSAVGVDELQGWSREKTTARLVEAGDWIALRVRPFGKIATPGDAPAAIFVRAMDSNPLAVEAATVFRERPGDLRAGLSALSRLTDGPLYLCSRPGTAEAHSGIDRLEQVEFAGPHPAGLVGTHAHCLSPVSPARYIWYIGYQDVLAIGRLFLTGRPDPWRVASLAGPAVRNPRLLRTLLGASSEDLVRGELEDERCRIVSGPILSGRVAAQQGAFLGRYHEQLCAFSERTRTPGTSWWIPSSGRLRRVPLWARSGGWSHESHGEPTGFYPVDLFDRVFPLGLPIAPLLRALAAGDTRAAAAFGALELEEEDLALSTYLCPAKLEYGPLLRRALDQLADQSA